MLTIETIVVSTSGAISGAILGSFITAMFQKKLFKNKTYSDKRLEVYSLIVRNMELLLSHSNGTEVITKNNTTELTFMGQNYIPRESLAKETLALIAQIKIISNPYQEKTIISIKELLEAELCYSKKPFTLTYEEWLEYEVGLLRYRIITRLDKIKPGYRGPIHEELGTNEMENRLKNRVLKKYKVPQIKMMDMFKERTKNIQDTWAKTFFEIKKEFK